MNKLIYEKSPYLQQHAQDPVDWYPWGAEAFQRAQKLHRPIFLSIGYSTCHWCHVMARESFAQQQVAQVLNRDFVAIKVDREERPDVDAAYMAACQAMTGSGGWPLTIVMTPQQQPFFAATYLPKDSSPRAAGLLDILTEIARRWREELQTLEQAGGQIAGFIRQEQQRTAPPQQPGEPMLDQGLARLRRLYDRKNGGFGGAPKFPMAHDLLFLLARPEPEALEMAEHTLQQMGRGGICDQIGGGFCRYAVDAQWRTPHFEKMLYDNALLILAYAQAYHRTGKEWYRQVETEAIRYLLREMQGEKGGFYSAQDADSQGEEGRYYWLEPQEVAHALGPEGEAFCRRYAIDGQGHLPHLLETEDWQQAPPRLALWKGKLLEYRKRRAPLHRDDKVLTAWNGLAIGALAQAGRLTERPEAIRAAEQAAEFVWHALGDGTGDLNLRWRQGEAAGPGQLDDYAFFAWGLLELYQARQQPRDLERALLVAQKMRDHFWDEAEGGFWMTRAETETPLGRLKPVEDGAMPSGNSMAALVLGHLSCLTGQPDWEELASRQQWFLAGQRVQSTAVGAMGLLALEQWLHPPRQLVQVGATLPEEPGWVAQCTDFLRLTKTPDNSQLLAQLAPYTAHYPVPPEGCRWYLCDHGACQAPVSSWDESAWADGQNGSRPDALPRGL